MRREFGVDEETMFEKWSYWQFRAFLAAVPKALGTDRTPAEDDRAGAIDTAEMDLEDLAALGLNVKMGPG